MVRTTTMKPSLGPYGIKQMIAAVNTGAGGREESLAQVAPAVIRPGLDARHQPHVIAVEVLLPQVAMVTPTTEGTAITLGDIDTTIADIAIVTMTGPTDIGQRNMAEEDEGTSILNLTLNGDLIG